MSIESDYKSLEYQGFIDIYYSCVSDGWLQVQKYVNKAFNIISINDYEIFKRDFSVNKFDYKYMRTFYTKNKIHLNIFDDDIQKYIAFIATLGYFERIGNPDLNVWINAKNQNNPIEDNEDNGYKGNSLLSLLEYNNGMNVVRRRLLSAWKIVT